jgi:hypothetical protein
LSRRRDDLAERVPLVVAEALDCELVVAEARSELSQAWVIDREQVRFCFRVVLLS